MVKNSRILGIDFGAKRIGLAVSDESALLARPHSIIPNDKEIFKKIRKILTDESIGGIVVGESLDFSGEPNAIFSQAEIFISKLKKNFGLPVFKEKEFLSSVEARREGVSEKNKNTGAHSRVKKEKPIRVDAKAAAIILQRYLDRKNKK